MSSIQQKDAALETINLEEQRDIEDPEIELASTDEPKMEEEEEQEEQELTEEELKIQRWNRNKKIMIGLVLLGFIIFVIIDSTTTGYLRSGINTALQWIEDNAVAGMFVFMVVYFVATVLFIPGSILTLGAGFVFANAFGLGVGLLIGTLSVFVGASAGAIAAFLLGRFLLRDWVKSLAGKYAVFEALDIGTCVYNMTILNCVYRISHLSLSLSYHSPGRKGPSYHDIAPAFSNHTVQRCQLHCRSHFHYVSQLLFGPLCHSSGLDSVRLSWRERRKPRRQCQQR